MTDPLVILTAATALFTAILAVFTILLAIYTGRLAKTARDTAERQLRAYVQVEIEKIDFNDTSGVEVVLLAKNVGQTPAYFATVHSWVDIRPFPHPKTGTFVGPNGQQQEAASIINGGQAIRNKTGGARPLTQDEGREIARGTSARLYVYGNVVYTDAFQKMRRTHFCFALQGTPHGRCDVALAPCHNDAT